MIRRFLQTEHSYALLALRLGLAVVIFPQGAKKVLGWYGGFGFDATMQFFASICVPAVVALLVIASDFLGALALAAGIGGRLAALGTAMVMIGAIALVHGEYGFFINWYGTQQGEGIQFHILALAASIVLMLKGSGAWSIDRLLAGSLPSTPFEAASEPELLRAA